MSKAARRIRTTKRREWCQAGRILPATAWRTPRRANSPCLTPLDRQVKDVPFHEALRFWLKLGFISFGGPAGQIAIMHQELVERRRWISEGRFLHALNFCMLLPGPEAQQQHAEVERM